MWQLIYAETTGNIPPPPPMAPPPMPGGGPKPVVKKSDFLPIQMVGTVETSTVFSDLDIEDIPFSSPLLASQFTAKKKAPSRFGEGATSTGPKLLEIVSGTPRAGYTSAIKKLAWTDTTRDAVQTAYYKFIENNPGFIVPKEKEAEFSLLFALIPGPKELKTIKEKLAGELKGVPEDKFGSLDNALISVVSIPSVREKMESINEMSSFPDAYTETKRKAEGILTQLREIRNSPRLKEIIRYTFALAKAVNLGQGEGFRAANLLNLKKQSSPVTSGLTYLHLLVKSLQQGNPDALLLEKDLPNVNAAILEKVKGIDEAINEWKNRFANLKDEEVVKTPGYQKAKDAFLLAWSPKLQELLSLQIQVKTEYEKIHKFYLSTNDDLGSLTRNLITDLQKAIKDLSPSGKFGSLNLSSSTVTVNKPNTISRSSSSSANPGLRRTNSRLN